jgi:transposase, IS5 family
VVLLLLILKHIRNWSYAVLEREVRANLVYREFTRVRAAKMPDAKTMGRWVAAMGPVVIHQIHDRIVQIARANNVVQGRRMRIDTTVVESNIHYPTDSSLLGDGVRVLTRTMRKITQLTGQVGAKLRDRSRSVGLAAAGDCPSSARQGSAEPGQDEARLWQAAERDRPGGGTGETILKGDCHRREARYSAGQAGGAGRPPPIA